MDYQDILVERRGGAEALAMGLVQYRDTEESRAGVRAFREKRAPDSRRCAM